MPKTTSRFTKHVKQDARNSLITKKEGWIAEDLGEESSYEGTTEMGRRLRRGDESVGDPDERDVAGGVPEKDTPHGREVRRKPRRSPTEENQNKKRG